MTKFGQYILTHVQEGNKMNKNNFTTLSIIIIIVIIEYIVGSNIRMDVSYWISVKN